MQLDWKEYQNFRTLFHHLFWPDGDYRFPIEVRGAEGEEWTLYIRPDQVNAVRQWLNRVRIAAARDGAPMTPNIRELPAEAERIEG